MKNRYDNLLLTHNQDILDLCPYNPILFIEGAKEIERVYREGARVLEIGSGEGDSALPLLARTSISLDLLDISEEMNTLAAKKLAQYKDRTHFICEDANEYLKRSAAYDIIFAAWTIHNFNQSDKHELLKSVYTNLNVGGIFILMDKVYPMEGRAELLVHQNERYTRYLLPEVVPVIIAHELEDASDEYRMDEVPFLAQLSAIGFSSVTITDRIERDVIIVAQKP
jgi:ubiquinone/menaquinone biosynthesis C-methylase UbiE